MDSLFDTLADLSASAVGVACDCMRVMVGFALAAALIFGCISMQRHVASEQSAQAAVFDRFTRPLAVGAAQPTALGGVGSLRVALGE